MRREGIERVAIDARGMQPRSTGLGNYIRNGLVPLADSILQVNFYQYSDAYEAAMRAGGALPDLILAGSVGWLQSDPDVGRADDGAGTVKCLGIEDLPSLYAGATALLMPTIYEGFGMPVLEAQRCGTLVVHGSHESMVEAAGRLGVTVEPQAAAWRDVFEQFERAELPLVSRLPADSALHVDGPAAVTTIFNASCAAARSRTSAR